MKAARNEMVFISDVWGLIGLVDVIPISEDSRDIFWKTLKAVAWGFPWCGRLAQWLHQFPIPFGFGFEIS